MDDFMIRLTEICKRTLTDRIRFSVENVSTDVPFLFQKKGKSKMYGVRLYIPSFENSLVLVRIFHESQAQYSDKFFQEQITLAAVSLCKKEILK